MTNSADPDQLASCKDRVYPGSAGLGLMITTCHWKAHLKLLCSWSVNLYTCDLTLKGDGGGGGGGVGGGGGGGGRLWGGGGLSSK